MSEVAWRAHGFADENEATNFAIDHLRAKGMTVHVSPKMDMGAWETPGAFAARMKCSGAHLWRRMQREDCPPFEARRGPSGRIIRLRSNPALEAFVAHA